MFRISKIIFIALILMVLAYGSANAQVFEGLQEGGEEIGLCIGNPDIDACDGIDCNDPAVTDPKCMTQSEAGTKEAKGDLASSGITHTDKASDLIIKYVNFLLPYLTLAAFVGFVVAGFFYVTAYGNEEQLGKAKKILIWSAVGLIIVMLSFAIVQFLTSGLLGQL
jgi:hypothetical protein